MFTKFLESFNCTLPLIEIYEAINKLTLLKHQIWKETLASFQAIYVAAAVA